MRSGAFLWRGARKMSQRSKGFSAWGCTVGLPYTAQLCYNQEHTREGIYLRMRIIQKTMQAAAYVVLLAYLGVNIFAEHSGRFLVPVQAKLVFAAGFIVLWAIATFSGDAPQSEEARRGRMKRFLLGLFVYYVWILGNMLFFDAAFGRSQADVQPPLHFYEGAVNLTPFKTIRNYLHSYERGILGGGIVAINLLGNVAAFAPMGFFLPALCRPLRNFFLFTLGLTALISAVEFTQIYTGTGSCDIDDLILNLAGALLVWLIVQLPFVKRHVYYAKPKRRRGI